MRPYTTRCCLQPQPSELWETLECIVKRENCAENKKSVFFDRVFPALFDCECYVSRAFSSTCSKLFTCGESRARGHKDTRVER